MNLIHHPLDVGEFPRIGLHRLTLGIARALPAVIHIDIRPSMLDEPGRNHRPGRIEFAFLIDLIAPDVVRIPSHRRRQADRVADHEAKLPIRFSFRVRDVQCDFGRSRAGERSAQIPRRRVQSHAFGESFGRIGQRLDSGRRNMKENGTAGPHAKNRRPVDARGIARRRRQDELRVIGYRRRGRLTPCRRAAPCRR